MSSGVGTLSPLLVFLAIYLGMGIIVGDFSRVPITVAFLFSTIYALLMTKETVAKRMRILSLGVANKDVIYMIWIFLLAGAFAQSAKAMGAIDATVNSILSLLPISFILPGLFISTCIVSFAIGTSVGTIAALTPVALGLAPELGLSTEAVVAIIVGGAFFGDNLSFISDTTIVATQTQRCKMSDKFMVNSWIVVPVAILTMLVYFFMNTGTPASANMLSSDLYKVIPYLLVITIAIIGLNVMTVLFLGILSTGVIGVIDGSYDIFGWFKSLSDGMLGMSELIIMTLLATAMLTLIRHNGGISYIISKLTRSIKGKKGAEFCIAALVCLVNVCTANNTVAIMTVGPIAADISKKYGIDKRMSASILDTASCFTQGLLPYGAQILIASSMAGVTPFSIIPYLYYPLLIGVALILAVLFNYPRKYIGK